MGIYEYHDINVYINENTKRGFGRLPRFLPGVYYEEDRLSSPRGITQGAQNTFLGHAALPISLATFNPERKEPP